MHSKMECALIVKSFFQFFILSGVVAMVTCAVFLRLSCLLKLAVLMLVIAVYTYLIEVAFRVLFIREHQNDQIQRYSPPHFISNVYFIFITSSKINQQFNNSFAEENGRLC